MESPDLKKKSNDISFYLLMVLLGLSVAISLGYLVYAILFG